MPEEKFTQIEQQVEAMQRRNALVEAEKSWESSPLRLFIICFITYVFAAAFIFLIDRPFFYLKALIPVLGFLLSTLSIPPIKKRWVNRYVQTHPPRSGDIEPFK